jgi:hypothetical protein
VLDKEGTEVHPILHVGVKGAVDDAHLGYPLAKNRIHEEGGEVANGGVLDGT